MVSAKAADGIVVASGFFAVIAGSWMAMQCTAFQTDQYGTACIGTGGPMLGPFALAEWAIFGGIALVLLGFALLIKDSGHPTGPLPAVMTAPMLPRDEIIEALRAQVATLAHQNDVLRDRVRQIEEGDRKV